MASFEYFSDLELARRLERAEAESCARFVEARARAFPESGAAWIDVAGTYAMYDGASSPVTQTFGLGLFETATVPDLEKIESFFEDRGAPVIHEVSPLAGIPIFALLNQRRYQPVELSSVMYRPLGCSTGSSSQAGKSVHVRVISGDEHDVWLQTAAKGWSEIADLADFIGGSDRVWTGRENTVSFLAELDGQPIAADALCITAGVAVLAGACTIPEARKRGAQLALLDARLGYAASHGCDIALLCAAPGSASQRNGERHGFRIAYTRTKWQRVTAVDHEIARCS
jgi:GNAT superfamily N-acetyltransferase